MCLLLFCVVILQVGLSAWGFLLESRTKEQNNLGMLVSAPVWLGACSWLFCVSHHVFSFYYNYILIVHSVNCEFLILLRVLEIYTLLYTSHMQVKGPKKKRKFLYLPKVTEFCYWNWQPTTPPLFFTPSADVCFYIILWDPCDDSLEALPFGLPGAVGAHLWPSAQLSAAYLRRRYAYDGFNTIRALELGSGCGVVGLVAAAHGAEVTKQKYKETIQNMRVWATF